VITPITTARIPITTPKISPTVREFLLPLGLGRVVVEVVVGYMDTSDEDTTSLVLIFDVLWLVSPGSGAA